MTELEQRAVEVGLLGAILKSSKNFAFISENVRPDYFSWDCYRELYGAMLELADKGLGIDTITVGDAMESKNRLSGFTLHDDNVINGRLALSVLRDEGMPENSISYAQILKNYAANKEILETVTKGAGWVAGGRNPSETIADLTKSLLGIDTVDSKTSTATISFSLAVEKAFDMYESASRGNSTFIQTGLRLLDRAIVGLSAPDLVIVAARPGVGKTAFLSTIVYNIMQKYTKNIAFFSLEMGSEQVAMRFLSMESGVNYQKQRSGSMTELELQKYLEAKNTFACNNYPLYLNDIPQITPNKIRAELRRLGKVDLLVLDYLQLANSDDKKESRHLEVGAVSRGLKAIAKEFHIPVLVAAQLSRESAKRTGQTESRKPILSDLAESGSIERDADIVIFLDREDGASEADVILAKQRNGEVGVFSCEYLGERTMFRNR